MITGVTLVCRLSGWLTWTRGAIIANPKEQNCNLNPADMKCPASISFFTNLFLHLSSC
jgi:hypothetical protein